MTCPLPRPTAQEIYDRNAARFSANVLGGSPIIPESNEFYVVALETAVEEEFRSLLAQAYREANPALACCDNLVALAALDGVYPRAAVFAQGYVQVTGKVGALLPTLLQMSFGEYLYKTVGSIPAVIPASGFITVQVKAVTPGVNSNSPTETSGTLATSIPNVDRVVTVYTTNGSSFCGGAPAEACEDFRARYLARKAYSPRGTSVWLHQKMLEWPCATRAIKRSGNCCTQDEGCGCGCNASCSAANNWYLMFDNTFTCGIAPASLINEVNTWLFGDTPGAGEGQVEIGVCGKIYPVSAFNVDVSLSVVCTSSTLLADVKLAIADVFARARPSTDIRFRELELAVVQVLGTEADFDIEFRVSDITGGKVTTCGDLSPMCDYVPCLGSIIVDGSVGKLAC